MRVYNLKCFVVLLGDVSDDQPDGPEGEEEEAEDNVEYQTVTAGHGNAPYQEMLASSGEIALCAKLTRLS